MKNLYLIILSLLFGFMAFAQPAKQILKLDTINMSGYLYDQTGQPLKYVRITSKAPSILYTQYHAGAQTDTNGHFVINGALPNDTLTINHQLYNQMSYYNHGSRYVVLYLTARINEVKPSQPIEIIAQRTHKKQIPTFTVTHYEGDPPFFEVESVACPVGGFDGFAKYIKAHLYYPEKAIAHNIEGTVKVKFIIEKDGSITKLQILNGLGYGCDEALLKAVEQSPKWRPGQTNGRALRTPFEMSVGFRLLDQ